MNALEKRGVAASQLKSKGIGETEAVVDENASEEERLKDRKVIVRTVNGEEWIKIKKKDTKQLKVANLILKWLNESSAIFLLFILIFKKWLIHLQTI